MYRAKRQQFDWTFPLIVGDIVAAALSFPSANAIVEFLWNRSFQPSLFACVIYGLLLLYFMRSRDLYGWQAFTRLGGAVLLIAQSVLLAIFVFVGFGILFGSQKPIPYAHWFGVHGMTLTCLLFLERAFLRIILMDVFQVVPVERIAFIGWSSRLERVLRALAVEMGKFQKTVGFFEVGPSPTGAEMRAQKYVLLGDFQQLEKTLHKQDITLLLVEEGCITSEQFQILGDICARSLVNLKVIPAVFDLWATKLNLRVVAGVPLFGVYNLRIDRFYNRIAKRFFDFLGASIGLVLSAPVIALLAILIKRESPGPIFFRQTRLGIYGKPFQILKLRSMRSDAEQATGAVWAVQDDPRRLNVGVLMRKWNLDELPQFWNVFKGDMSLVGPRPERPEFVEEFKENVHYYNLRHSCQPGMTGWAAVHGLRGNTSLKDRLEYDLFYIENWSLWLDVRIILMTLRPPKNAY